ncbi:MAG: hypothetical protein HYZ57_09550 [Acidobacteria bacterium]|nr:hypothetical protein [Acidobacteriota bacterium]MBI3280072.1 hypothetical protein [Acidobacteriota bacterium]
MSRKVRTAVALAFVAGLVYLAIVLAPPYRENWQLQRFLDQLVQRAETHHKPPEEVQVDVLRAAAGLGLPLRPNHVHVQRSQAGITIDVRYIVTVDFPLYTVDLHMRSSAGGH